MAARQQFVELRGHLRIDEPMSKHTSWRVGGDADHFYEPADLADLVEYIRQLPTDENVILVGLGSNLLVRDRGIRGSVICPTGLLNELEFMDDDTLRVEAGVPCAIVAKRCAKAGYTGLEFLAGIPGTIGGALAMNAGAFGGETWPNVIKVETLDRQGQLHVRKHQEYEIGYRTVNGPENEWFVAAHLKLSRGDGEAGLEKIKQLLAERSKKQPMGLPSCGSVFRNPEGDHAARLIEQAGLKGMQIGGAEVSQKHANFIINTGNAMASDIENLIEKIAQVVEVQTGKKLICEVKITGERIDEY